MMTEQTVQVNPGTPEAASLGDGKKISQQDLLDHLARQYAGVLSEDKIRSHIDNYVEESLAGENLQEVLRFGQAERLLDIGCGYGSFVMLAREAGIEAYGLDVAEFDIAYAKQRLAERLPELDPEQVYQLASGTSLPYADESFDVVTLWNVLEHVPDWKSLLGEARRVLRPGGRLHLICPNYAAFRQEAHYYVFWPPLLPRPVASVYLRLLGRNPSFFETSIFYRTNLGTLNTLRKLGFSLLFPFEEKLANPERIVSRKGRIAVGFLRKTGLMSLARLLTRLAAWNPWKRVVSVVAVRGDNV